MDTFQIFVWAVKTARLLDVLAAHEGPVVAMAFSPLQPLLASASWDKTVRTWDVFRSWSFYNIFPSLFLSTCFDSLCTSPVCQGNAGVFCFLQTVLPPRAYFLKHHIANMMQWMCV